MTAPRLSRRALFGAGFGRLLEERLAGLDHAVPGYEAPAQADPPESAGSKETARQAWEEGDPRPLSAKLEPAAAHLLEVCGVEPGQRMLDVGAGDGNLAVAAARAGAEVAAADFSPVLVERGRERARVSRADIDWTVADVEALPYADATFDCVASNFGVIYAEDPRRAIAEVERVVRPAGLVAITAWAPSGFMGGVLRLAAGRHGSAQPRVRPERWGRFETAFLHFSGFDDFEMLEATLQMQFEGDDEMWELFASPPGPLAGAVRTAGDADALREEFVRLAAASRSETTPGVALDVEYAVVLGRRQEASAPASPLARR